MIRTSLFCLLLLLAAGCREAESDAPVETGTNDAPDTAEDRAGTIADSTVISDSTGLILVDNLPLGGTVNQMREVLPAFAMMEGEAAVENEMERATAPYTLFGRPGHVELNFDDGKLASYFFRLEPLACASADSLYERVQKAYSKRFGSPQEDTKEEDGYRAQTSYWAGDSLGASVRRGEKDGHCRLLWGFEADAP